MTSKQTETAAILKLPNEILSAIISFQDSNGVEQGCSQILNLRLICRRFCALCHHHVIRHKVVVDLSRPRTLELLGQVLDNPVISDGIREVYVRLHFYHPWIAANCQNFVSSVLSEWQQRRQSWHQTRPVRQDTLTFHDMVHIFLEELAASQNARRQNSEGSDASKCTPRSLKILHRAYHDYRVGFEVQKLWLVGERFAKELANTLSMLPNLRQLTIHDGELGNNYGPGTKVSAVDSDDIQAQNEILVKVLSRPMLWEDARWIMPNESIWAGVPIHLLVDIPLAIGSVASIILDHLAIEVSAAPDYTGLGLDEEVFHQLSLAAESMDLFQFTFQPRCRSDSGPWAVGDEGLPIYAARTADEMGCLNGYLDAILHAKCISHASINLGEFWFSAGVESILHAPSSLGAGRSWSSTSKLNSLCLSSVCLTDAELTVLAKSLHPKSELELVEVYLRIGTWMNVLDVLRQELRDSFQVRIRYPLGGGIDVIEEEQVRFAFDSGNSPTKPSRAERFVMGEDIHNPLQLSVMEEDQLQSL
ncbi:hypothetical protein BGZ63DRAFT_462035 [Mariannaea sp. PMI_226]|nr:hypothetical protein BGZ63DRAFT_462035 [Mariannaea sp. PMI_226]